ncbi:MarR family winged helix-turn-helix transcriptional regulator [Micromonospora sp. LZ34]
MTAAGVPTPAHDEPEPEFVGEFGWALMTLLREWSARVESAVGDLPYGTRGYQVLSAVVRDEPPSQASLATRLGIDRSVMTYLIDRCVESGLVERQQDPADRRARRIVPTEHGRRRLDELDARVREVETDLLGTLPEAQRELLHRLLRQAANGVAHDPDRCAVTADAMGAVRDGTGSAA